MKWYEIAILGGLYSLYTGLSEFLFNHPINAFAFTLGILVAGLILGILEFLREENIYTSAGEDDGGYV